MKKLIWGTIFMLVMGAISMASGADAGEGPVIMLILDASGSMWREIEGVRKIEVAKNSLSEVIDGFPENATVGLIAYGHRAKGDCNDVEEITELDKIDKTSLKNRINALHPKGKTPITASIQKAVNTLKSYEEESTIILVSDGMETCQGDPCEMVKELKTTGVKFVMNVIGFDVSEEERIQLECIAGEGGGKYYSANNVNEFQVAARTVAQESVTAPKAKAVAPAPPECAVKPCTIAELNTTFEAELIKENEKMFYRLDVPGQGYIRAEVSNMPQGFTAGYYFLDAQGKEIMKTTDSNAIAAREGTYYFGLYEKYGKVLEVPLHTKITFIEEMDPFEANNSVNEAKQVPTGEEFSFATYPRWDKDFFKVEVPGDGYINVVLTEPVSGMAYQYYFAAPSEETAFERASIKEIMNTRDSNSIRVTKGTYIIGLSDVYNNFPQSLQQAKAKIFFIEEVDPFEANNTPEQAKPVALNEEISFATYPRWDKDYFKVEVPGDGYINVVLTEPVNGMAYQYYFAAPGEETAFERAALKEIMNTRDSNSIRVTQGTYIIGLSDVYNNFPKSLQRAKAKIFFIDEIDQLEPNNKTTSAAPIKLDREYPFAIYPRWDSDFYKVQAPQDGTLRIQLTEPVKGLAYNYHFYDESGNQLQVTRDNNALQVKKGTYIVGVSDVYNSFPKNLQQGKFKVVLSN